MRRKFEVEFAVDDVKAFKIAEKLCIVIFIMERPRA